MNLFQIIKKYFSEKFEFNLPALIICFVISIFLYYAYYSQTIVSETYSYELKDVKIISGNGYVNARPPSNRVQIQVSIDRKEIDDLNAGFFKPYIDLSYVSIPNNQYLPLECDLPVLIDLAPRLKDKQTLQIKCIPSHVSIFVDEFVEDIVNVEPIISTPPKGYKLGAVKVTPSYVTISGPKSRVDEKKASLIKTELIKIPNATTSFSNKYNLENYNEFIKLSDDKVNVEVSIIPEISEKKLNSVKVNLINVDSKLDVMSYMSAINVTFAGPQNIIDSFTIPNDFVTADCSHVHSAGKFNVPINVKLQNGLSLSGEIVKNIAVTFNTKTIQVENSSNDKNEDEPKVVLEKIEEGIVQ